jgi:hypothetical protein
MENEWDHASESDGPHLVIALPEVKSVLPSPGRGACQSMSCLSNAAGGRVRPVLPPLHRQGSELQLQRLVPIHRGDGGLRARLDSDEPVWASDSSFLGYDS